MAEKLILPASVPGGWTIHEVIVAGRTFKLRGPAEPDRFLEQLDERDAADGCPYWAALWPASKQMAQFILDRAWPPGTRALELGCGVGLVGIAALAAGLKVTFSDAVPLAVQVATENAVRNGLQPDRGRVLDWHEPPSASYPLIFASDVLYDRDLHGPLLNTLDCVLAPDGECWIGEPGRSVADEFITTLKQRGFSVNRYQLPRPPSARESVIFRVVFPPPDL